MPEQAPSNEEKDTSPEDLAASPDDERNVFDDDEEDAPEVGEQADEAPAGGEHPVETPAVAEPEEASTVIETPRERETPRDRLLKRAERIADRPQLAPANMNCFLLPSTAIIFSPHQ